ncbi:MAG: LUD domain-containing protein [Sulfobacillus sp.]|nr:LUD domain-containing protein [Sulfobacillus sp.]
MTYDLVTEFQTRLTAAGATVRDIGGVSNWEMALTEVWTCQIVPVLPADASRFVSGWVDAPALQEIIESVWPVRWGDVEPSDRALVPVGLTGCAWAAADTGTVALYGRSETPLWPSVLPRVHVVCVARHAIVSTVAEGLARLRQDLDREAHPTQVKLISGPSMTADIEGELIIGVHGPKHLIVLVYDSIL